MSGTVTKTLDFTLYYNKISEYPFPLVSSNLANDGNLVAQDLQVSATLQTSSDNATSSGAGELLIEKVSAVDQANNKTGLWQYTCTINNSDVALGPGQLVFTIPMNNNYYWPDSKKTNSNPTEVTSDGVCTVPGIITFGTGVYFTATGKVTKIKYDSTPYRRLNFELTISNPADPAND